MKPRRPPIFFSVVLPAISVAVVGLAVAGYLLFVGSNKTPPVSQEVAAKPPAAKPASPPKPKPRTPPEAADAPVPLETVLKTANHAVVYIVTLDALGNPTGLGSGFLIDARGWVATNYHVLADAVKAYVQFQDGHRVEIAGCRGYDEGTDLAVLQLQDVPPHAARFELRKPREPNQGDNVTAIGHPSGFKFTVTTGIVSAVRATAELPVEVQQSLRTSAGSTWIQTTAAISGGNSGGPLLNNRGQVVGVNSWIARGAGLGFAIHVRHLLDLTRRLDPEPHPLPLPDLGLISDATVASIVGDYAKERGVFVAAVQAARTEADAKRILKERNPDVSYLPKLLAVAERPPAPAAACDALANACELLTRCPPEVAAASTKQAVALLRRDHVSHPEMATVALTLRSSGAQDVIALQQELIRNSPHRKVQAAACFSLAVNLAARPDLAAAREPEIRALLSRVVEDYPGVTIRGVPLEQIAQPLWFALKHLGEGMEASDIVGTTLAGESLALRDFRGKVVLLDFWADWCPYCREMYPHGRQLLERHKDKPFALLGVNCDQRPRAEEVAASGQVPWKSWYDGPQGPIAQTWQIQGYPTTYLLDKEGKIRFKNLRGPDLDAAIDSLLQEGQFTLSDDLLPVGATWRYFDRGGLTGADWRQPAFDDGGWSSGAAPLGYGAGDEATSLYRPMIGQDRPLTCYFRTTFNVADPAAVKDLAVSLYYDDGVALYLNGAEALRKNLPPAAQDDTAALRAPPDHGRVRHVYGLDPKLLRPGPNVLAAEVHQESLWSADLRFAAGLSANQVPRLLERLAQAQAGEQRDALRLLGNLRSAAAPAVPLLRSLVKDPQPRVAVEAFLALVSILPDQRSDLTAPQGADASATKELKLYSQFFNAASWEVVKVANDSPDDYQAAYRHAVAASLLAPEEGGITNTLGVAAYRIGRYDEALQTLRKSYSQQGANPCDLAAVAMVQARLQRADKAAQALRQAQELMAQPKWSQEEDIRSLLQEAAELLKTSPAP